tara:strand:+ start:584 stop:1249 length:666 start_codon:yes stop_codon:yes gene_type:complete
MSYNKTVYNSQRTPKTKYPEIFCRYIVKNFGLKKNSNILDVGSGRGEFAEGFSFLGLNTFEIDIEENDERNKDLPFKKCDLLKDDIPFEDNFFDIIFHKSVLEHFTDPEMIIDKMKLKLKPGGVLIGMVPDWETQYKTFYHDHTHRTPFMRESLEDLLKIKNFKKINVKIFRQLPSVWNNKFLMYLSIMTQIFLPDLKILYKFKWIRFSKELMILSYAEKQ